MRLPKKWVISLGLLAAMPGATWAGPFDLFRGQSPAASQRDNQQMADDIATALRSANLQGCRNVEIQFEDGTATILGEAASREQIETVTRVTSSVPGVQTVNNLMRPLAQPAVSQAGFQGSPSGDVSQISYQEAPADGRSNQQVAQEIAQCLVQSGLGGSNVEVRYQQGAASLIGEVNSADEAYIAESAARQVPGVHEVINRLTVNGELVAQAGGYQQGQIMQTAGMPYGPAMQSPYGYQPGPAPSPQLMQAGPAPMMAPGGYGHAQPASHMMYNNPHLPETAWPSYAPYDNYAAVTYPGQYDASAWPYIGPYYPYPQVPLGWRQATLEWDDGYWSLKFNSRTDKWWWFLHPKNWD
jgi:osmotically-inducible protein OsmY